MPTFLKFRDEQDALGLKFLRPSVKKLVFGHLEPIKRQLKIFTEPIAYSRIIFLCDVS